MGKKQKRGKAGNAVQYMTRNQAIKKLQLRLSEFRCDHSSQQQQQHQQPNCNKRPYELSTTVHCISKQACSSSDVFSVTWRGRVLFL
jgi:hypothetical protein